MSRVLAPSLRRHALPVGWALVALVAVYRPLFSGEVLGARDAFRQFIPDSHFLVQSLRAGELPLWTPHQRLGQPFAATPHTQAWYPLRVIPAVLLGPARGLSVEQLLHSAVAFLGAYLFSRRLGARRFSAWLGAGAFAVGPLFSQLGLQQNVVASLAWTGFLLLAAEHLSRRPSARSAAGLAVPVALSLLAGSPETLLWQGALAGCWMLRRPGWRARLGWGAFGIGWGVALAGVLVLPAAELTLHSTRTSGAQGALEWSVPPASLLSLLLLNADLPRKTYWGGEQQFVPVLFVGVWVGLLAVASGLRGPRTRPRPGIRARSPQWLLGGCAVLLALLSLGQHFAPSAALLALPPFSFFRYPAKYVPGAAFALCLLAPQGLDRLCAWVRRRRMPGQLPAVAVAVGLGLPWLGQTLVQSFGCREGLRVGLGWAGVFTAAGLLALATARGAHRSAKVRFGLGVTLMVELVLAHAMVGTPQWYPERVLMQHSPLAPLLPSLDNGRISVQLLPEGPKERGNAYVEQSRPALVPLRFVEEGLAAVEGYGAPEPRYIDALLAGQPRAVFDLMGVSHYLREGPAPFGDLTCVREPEQSLPGIYASTTAGPRAFIVHRAVQATDEEALAALRNPDTPARHTAYLAEGAPLASLPHLGCSSTARLTKTGAQDMELEIAPCQKGYLLLTDAWFPGWKAEVDGHERPVLRADLLLRAVFVEPHERRVILRYAPASFRAGLSLTVGALVALAVVLGRRRQHSRA